MDRFRIGDILVSRTNLAQSLERIYALHREGKFFGYLCHMDTRTAYLASHDDSYRAIQNHSLMTFLDGMPLVWFARKQGYAIA
jgi:UDP-N-acetyl-D-mannosaminuronic acid transferase (WecB/TagA/CpsF family)